MNSRSYSKESPNVNHGTLDLFAAHRASNVPCLSVRVRCGTARAQIKMKFGTQVILALLFAGASAFVPASAPLRATSARAASKGQMEMAVPVGINGFGRIGRLVARIMCKSPETDLKLINSGASCEYMAYQMKYDSIHGRYDGTIEADGDVRPRAPPFPVSSSPVIPRSCARRWCAAEVVVISAASHDDCEAATHRVAFHVVLSAML